MDNIRPDRQTVMFSATFPRQMEALARKILSKPVEVQVGGRSVVCKDVKQSVVSLEMSNVLENLSLEMCIQVRLKPVTETSYCLEFLDVASTGSI